MKSKPGRCCSRSTRARSRPRYAQAVAVLARDNAQLVSAKNDADRYAALVQKDFVTKSQADQAVAAAAAAKALVAADQAALDNAKFNLDNATITAPITGKTGVLLVKQGNLVRPGSVPPLVVINQIHPIDVHFTVTDREFPLVQKYSAAAKKLRVIVTPRGIASAEEGELNMLDNGVDTTTGTVTLKAQFLNPQGHLWPGQFVAVALQLYVQEGAVLVPTTAVQTGQDGQFVFVISPDRTAVVHPVTAGLVVGDRTVIEKGIDVGMVVVTDGQSRLTPNAKVEIAAPAPVVKSNSAGRLSMNFTALFIKRPVMTTLVMVGILGLACSPTKSLRSAISRASTTRRSPSTPHSPARAPKPWPRPSRRRSKNSSRPSPASTTWSRRARSGPRRSPSSSRSTATSTPARRTCKPPSRARSASCRRA